MIQSKRFKLITQKPKPKVVCESGSLSVDRKGYSNFFTGNGDVNDKCVAEMDRARIEYAGAAAILLSGMQPDGFNKNGSAKYVYQEWLLVYPQDDSHDL